MAENDKKEVKIICFYCHKGITVNGGVCSNCDGRGYIIKQDKK